MVDLNEIDPKIWTKIFSYEYWWFIEMNVYKHVRNFGNNSDKFLFIITPEQEFSIPDINDNDEQITELINLKDDNLRQLKECESLVFVVWGICELNWIIQGFKELYDKHEKKWIWSK